METMDIAFKLAALLISVIALIFSIMANKRSKADIVRSYFHHGDSAEQKKYRQTLYDICKRNPEELTDEKYSPDLAQIISFYDLWALLYFKGYLPKWTFQGMPGKTALNVFTKIKPYIDHRRDRDHLPEYAAVFEKLTKHIKA